jgi:glutamate synthase domain-containing protein 1/glutamate synthase domain-containing protein 3
LKEDREEAVRNAESIITSRLRLVDGMPASGRKDCEGGCGVIGIIGTEPLPGRFIMRSCEQMHNRGNGKGGGLAATGLFADHREDYAIHMAYLEESVRGQIEKECLLPHFDIQHAERQPSLEDPREVGLEIRPPEVWRYFARVKRSKLDAFAGKNGFENERAAEDEFVYQNSFRLNRAHYAGLAKPRAFVLSHGRDLMILKGVGYAEQIARYYRLEEVKAHVWIGHQRYPTRGRVWHPGGAHPFIGLHEALVHNGDFANYHAVTEYLRQRGIVPLFVTDTEVSVLLFDLYARVLGYPLEYIIEALAPTPEGDFERLSKRRQRIYRAIQTAHLHGSPDGPWFFIVTRAEPSTLAPQLIGITDVSMLRPQVFAAQLGPEKSFGAIASEKQAIDAFFEEVSAEDRSVPPLADHYWNARGGSCTDGGAFSYTLVPQNGRFGLEVRNKFGEILFAGRRSRSGAEAPAPSTAVINSLPAGFDSPLVLSLKAGLEEGRYGEVDERIDSLHRSRGWQAVLDHLSFLYDRRLNPGKARRADLQTLLMEKINTLLDGIEDGKAVRLTSSSIGPVPAPSGEDAVLVIDARGFPPEGRKAVSRLIVEGYRAGWRRFIAYRCRGHRFIGCGLGADSKGVRIDVYGSGGDYLGSGLDGAEIYVHGNAQDQVGQILKAGRIVIFGDVGQTFLYGAKGGEAFVQGNAAGRPLINAVGKIRAVINGTCLDYCAESFMAGRQTGDGFVIINGLRFDERGEVIGLDMKYPGNNLFSLASGGACYLNDPYATVSETQLNGATFVPFRQEDWTLILPYLSLNETLFGISIRHDILMVDGVLKWPKEVFRKVVASLATEQLDWSSLTP